MIIVHHLANSRSQRVLWMLEELGLDYEMIRYARSPDTFQAPPELAKVHPLGKAPVIELDGEVIAESGAILEELGSLSPGRLEPPSGGVERRAWRNWLHYAEGSAMPALLQAMNFKRHAPDVPDRVAGDLERHLRWVDAALRQGDWLLPSGFGSADIQLSTFAEMAAFAGHADGLPNLLGWLARCQARPAYRRALQRGGAYAFAR